eukprot:tig00021105_g18281.t1
MPPRRQRPEDDAPAPPPADGSAMLEALEAYERTPGFKKVPNTTFLVDAFKHPNSVTKHWFLTHFHSDHYGGITRSWAGTVVCTEITAALVAFTFRIPLSAMVRLQLNVPVRIEGVEVTALEANHCPGAALFLFRVPIPGSPDAYRTYLHTGDMRYCPAMRAYPALANAPIDILYLDTTYCAPKHVFPTQDAMIDFVVDVVRKKMNSPRVLFVVGTYQIGKERVFVRLAQQTGFKVCVEPRKLELLRLCQYPMDLFTTDPEHPAARIRCIPLWHCNRQRLRELKASVKHRFDSIVAFRPTGWSFSNNQTVSRQQAGPGVEIYGVPYSEHSSFDELREFVSFLLPGRLVPTVNASSPGAVRAMLSHFRGLVRGGDGPISFEPHQGWGRRADKNKKPGDAPAGRGGRGASGGRGRPPDDVDAGPPGPPPDPKRGTLLSFFSRARPAPASSSSSSPTAASAPRAVPSPPSPSSGPGRPERPGRGTAPVIDLDAAVVDLEGDDGEGYRSRSRRGRGGDGGGRGEESEEGFDREAFIASQFQVRELAPDPEEEGEEEEGGGGGGGGAALGRGVGGAEAEGNAAAAAEGGGGESPPRTGVGQAPPSPPRPGPSPPPPPPRAGPAAPAAVIDLTASPGPPPPPGARGRKRPAAMADPPPRAAGDIDADAERERGGAGAPRQRAITSFFTPGPFAP